MALRSVVKRVVAKSNPSRGSFLASRKAQSPSEGFSLPDKPKSACDDFFLYASLIYGRPGIGKTTWAASFPDALLLSCERVSKGIECYDFNVQNGGVHSWRVLRAAVDLLEKNPDRFKTVVIDTIDAAYNQCLEYVCNQEGIDYPKENDFGKSWKKISREFTSVMDRLWATKRGIVFISHAKEVDIQSHSGEKYTRIQPTMSGQAYNFIKAKTDFVFYAEYYRAANGDPLRIIITSGDDVVDAKSVGNLPRFLPFTKEDGVDIVLRAFAGEDVGIDPATLKSDKQTSKAGGNLLTKARTRKVLRMGDVKA